MARSVVLVVLGVGLLSGCMWPATGVRGDVISELNCSTIDEHVDTPPLTVATLSLYASSVVIAEVESIEGGVWNTTDGAEPQKAHGPRFDPGIFTPIHLQVGQSISGDRGPGALRVVNPGGTVGCVDHDVDNAARVEKGETYAFVLQPSRDAEGGRHPELPQILVAFPIAADGSVETLHDGTLSHTDFIALVKNPVPPASDEP